MKDTTIKCLHIDENRDTCFAFKKGQCLCLEHTCVDKFLMCKFYKHKNEYIKGLQEEAKATGYDFETFLKLTGLSERIKELQKD